MVAAADKIAGFFAVTSKLEAFEAHALETYRAKNVLVSRTALLPSVEFELAKCFL